jgi:mono/diheme cytochrome c family protein
MLGLGPKFACGLLLTAISGAIRAQPPGRFGAPPPQAAAVPAPPQFARTCALCHGNDGRGTDRAPTMVNSAHLRTMTDAEIASTIKHGRNRMPAFPLPDADIDRLVRYIRSLNVTASSTAVPGDATKGEAIYFGAGQCSTCHIARGRGVSDGPDLSNIGSRMRLQTMQQVLENPGANMTPGYAMASVAMDDGTELRGFLRAEGSHG